ncbi:unnamed protein product [Strongylus vulgaris]|uniref:Uncharacterized protein n=1 Tax=Strongylus vulgaris TaxID=40348 RepID=A0A3P7K9N0_STRVU|nr:unnamed protein product [Strongylus vulgaris]
MSRRRKKCGKGSFMRKLGIRYLPRRRKKCGKGHSCGSPRMRRESILILLFAAVTGCLKYRRTTCYYYVVLLSSTCY